MQQKQKDQTVPTPNIADQNTAEWQQHERPLQKEEIKLTTYCTITNPNSNSSQPHPCYTALNAASYDSASLPKQQLQRSGVQQQQQHL